MKKLIIIIFLVLAAARPSHAINILEKIAYQKDEIRIYKAKVLINPLTHEIKYIWCRTGKGGYWLPLEGNAQKQYQSVYDRERASLV